MRLRVPSTVHSPQPTRWKPRPGDLRRGGGRLLTALVAVLLASAGLGGLGGQSNTWGQAAPQPFNPFLPGYGQPGTGLGEASLPALGSPPAQIAPPQIAPPQISSPQFPPPSAVPYSQFAPPAGQVNPTVPLAPGTYAPNVVQPSPFQPNSFPPNAYPAGGYPPGVVGSGSGMVVGPAGPAPFAAPMQVPPGYPNLPAPSSSFFGNPFLTPTSESSTVFAAPNSTGFDSWSGGLLNNPNANGTQTWSPQSWQRFWQASDWQKLWHAFRMRHTYIQGGTDDRVQINDSEIATSLSLPNFFGSQMPLTISPGFIIHNWEGPNSNTGDDLPGSAYSAYLSFDHSTPLDQQFGGEFNFTTGVFSDFSTFTQHSMRFMGTGLLWMRLSPTSTFKLGVEYLDRVEIKLLPVGGLFWTPDPNTRLSFFFPRPKFAKRFPNFGNVEVWGYLAGEYGGGSWTVRREAGFSDQVDLNDMRVTAGLEWIGIRGVTGFGEVGYVFERQIIYRSTSPNDNYLGSAIMFRGGFAY